MKSTLPPNLRVVITGAAGGLGRAFAVELASRGARIVVSDIVLEGCQETVELIKTNGGDAIAVTADVADWSSVQALENTANGWLGGIDLLINNAGVAVRGDVESVSLEDWDWIMGIDPHWFSTLFGWYVLATFLVFSEIRKSIKTIN